MAVRRIRASGPLMQLFRKGTSGAIGRITTTKILINLQERLLLKKGASVGFGQIGAGTEESQGSPFGLFIVERGRLPAVAVPEQFPFGNQPGINHIGEDIRNTRSAEQSHPLRLRLGGEGVMMIPIRM